MLHVVTQLCAAAGGQLQCVGTVRFGEIVDVAPVARRWSGRRMRLEQVVRRTVAVTAWFAEDEEVVAGGIDLDCQPDRVHRACLAEDFIRLGKRLGGLEIEKFRVAASAQQMRFERREFGHGHGSPASRNGRGHGDTAHRLTACFIGRVAGPNLWQRCNRPGPPCGRRFRFGHDRANIRSGFPGLHS
ncbi:hypothetical protein [Aromatoleum diolicum]|uniref:hypothetical protein n=1 Tax=Aromatoleum diolicum TaxID=75796 RepID=UPI0031B646D9